MIDGLAHLDIYLFVAAVNLSYYSSVQLSSFFRRDSLKLLVGFEPFKIVLEFYKSH